MTQLWLFSIPLLLATGWYIGRSNKSPPEDSASNHISREYFEGLNFLLNEQPDKAVDVFIKLLEVDGDTVETHLALGNLFRRRGEVDRAIRIHQNLIARPQLSKRQRIQALLALGQDYMGAGVFDRAERLFQEVVASGEYTTESLYYLLDIYQQERDWEKALAVAEQLDLASNTKMATAMSHYYCELAIEAKNKGQYDAVSRLLKKALSIDKSSVRASLLLGDLYQQKGQMKEAIRTFKQFKDQDPEFLAESLKAMVPCYEHLKQRTEMMSYLTQCLHEAPSTPLVLILADQLKKLEGDKSAANFIAEQLRSQPSITGLNQLIALHLNSATGQARDDLLILQSLTDKLIETKPEYRCMHCGYAGKVLLWQCPSCKKWSSVKPVPDIEGD